MTFARQAAAVKRTTHDVAAIRFETPPRFRFEHRHDSRHLVEVR